MARKKLKDKIADVGGLYKELMKLPKEQLAKSLSVLLTNPFVLMICKLMVSENESEQT